MPTLPQLLTEYTRRTGISDSELTVKNYKTFAVLLLIVVVMSAIAVFRFRTPSDYPIAAQGETLVLIAPLTASETVAPMDLSEALRAALERELQAAKLEHARVVIGPEKISDVTTAEMARLRSNARLVIYGKYESGALAATLDPAPAAFRANDLPLDALITAPTDVPLKIDVAAPEQMQALALYALAYLYADQGELDNAGAALMRSPLAQPAWLATSGYLYQLGERPDLDEAIGFYTQAIALDANAKTAYLDRGVAYIQQNKLAQWSADLARVLVLEPNHANAHQALCWAYALDLQPDAALPHCDSAVRLDPTPRSRDVRAVVHAEAGRLQNAATDWQVFTKWLAQQPNGLRVRYGSTRTEWLQAAQAGQNPIDSTVLERLRQQ